MHNDSEVRQGLFPLPTFEGGVLHDGSVLAAPAACRTCERRECLDGSPHSQVLICTPGYNFVRFDSHRTVVGLLLQHHHPQSPTSKQAQHAFTRNRRVARKASEGGIPSEFISSEQWRQYVAVLRRHAADQAAVRSEVDRDRLTEALQDDRLVESIRAFLGEATAGLASATRHDLLQVATAINGAIENILDLRYSSVEAAIGWQPPALATGERGREVWLREKAIFFFSELLTLRLNVGEGLPPEGSPTSQRSISPHSMFLKIIEPYRLLAKDRRIRIETSGASYGTTKAAYEPFFIPALAVVDNAVKYAPNDSTVDVRFSEDAEEISVEVSSYGPRIDEMERSAIFGAGVRGKHAQERADGQGLGLWLARTLLRRWGGHIAVSQRAERDGRTGTHYTTFSLTYARQ